MEPITMFAWAVGLISACHLTFSAAKFMTGNARNEVSQTQERINWYCCFDVDDLLGDTADNVAVRRNAELVQRRRAAQQRPRLQA